MKIEELTKGFRFYDADKFDFTWYDYLMPMPVNNPVNEGIYHIVINRKTEQPERIFNKKLQDILDKKLFSLEDVRIHQIKLVEDWLIYLNKNK